jgi:DNA gyrase subunit A
LLVLMENGYGKRTQVDQFATHARGGVGIKAGMVTAKTGKAVDVRAITDTSQEVVVVSTQGQVIRVPLAGISLISRVTQGVRIMRMAEGDKVASVALVGETVLDGEGEASADEAAAE